MSVKDLSKAWDEAAQRALETSQGSELPPERLTAAAGLHVRSGVTAGGVWGITDDCSVRCPDTQDPCGGPL